MADYYTKTEADTAIADSTLGGAIDRDNWSNGATLLAFSNGAVSILGHCIVNSVCSVHQILRVNGYV